MKTLATNLWKGPITTIVGLALLAVTCLSIYNDKITFMWDGSLMLLCSVALLVLNENQIATGIIKGFNNMLDKFKGGSGPQIPGAGAATVIIFALLAFGLSSCGVAKKITQQSDTKKEKIDSVGQLTEKIKQTEKITEEVDTTAKVKGFDSKVSTPIKELEKAPVVFENDNIKTTVRIDSAGNVKVENQVKDRNVHYRFKKETTKTIASSKDSKIEVKKDSKEVKKDRQKNVKRFGLPTWSWLVLILIGIALALYMTLRKKFSIIP